MRNYDSFVCASIGLSKGIESDFFLWAFQTHWQRRKTFLDAIIEPVHLDLKVLRMRSPGATRKWLKEATAYKVQGNN